MRGHERLIELRKAGKKPNMVFINDYPCQTDWFENPGDAVTITTYNDSIETLDMRFLVGLAVSVSSDQEKRAKALFNACKRHSAAVVAAAHVPKDWRQRDQAWAEVWRRGQDGGDI